MAGTPYNWNETWCYELSTIHPRPKAPLGDRLGRAALGLHYNRTQEHAVPVLLRCSVEAGVIRIIFDPTRLGNNRLTVQAYNHSQSGASAMEVEVNGAWQFADITAVSDTTVEVPFTGELTGVRYAWRDYPCCGSLDRSETPCPPMSCPLLTNSTREPAVPFIAQIIGGVCVCTPPMECGGHIRSRL